MLTAPGSKTWTFHYNDIGQPTYYNIPNGMTTNYSYDSRNRLTKIEHKDGSTVLDGFTYALDNFANITKTTHEDGSFWDYLYDGRYRLTSAIRSNANEIIEAAYSYTYDDGDNLLTKVEPFEDNFNDGNYTGWSVWSGTWSALNNYLRMTPGTAGTIAKANTDADLELRFTDVNNDTSDNNYYLVVGPRTASGCGPVPPDGRTPGLSPWRPRTNTCPPSGNAAQFFGALRGSCLSRRRFWDSGIDGIDQQGYDARK